MKSVKSSSLNIMASKMLAEQRGLEWERAKKKNL